MIFAFRLLIALSLAILLFSISFGQQPSSTPPSHADILRGAWGPYRSNNDLLSYYLDIRIDPDKKVIGGKNTITFKMVKNDSRIQLDLTTT